MNSPADSGLRKFRRPIDAALAAECPIARFRSVLCGPLNRRETSAAHPLARISQPPDLNSPADSGLHR